jgi:hypothetical protein
MNGIGEVYYTHTYWADNDYPLAGLGGIRQYGDNGYVFAAGVVKDTTALGGLCFHPCIGKFNNEGEIDALKYYEVDSGCMNYLYDVFVTADMSIIGWGDEGRGQSDELIILKVDDSLGPLWAKHYGPGGGFQFVMELPNGDLLAGLNMNMAGASVARLDANGNLLWCKSYFRPVGRVHDAVVEADGSVIVIGVTESTTQSLFNPLPTTFHPELFMMKLDGSGNVLWCKGYTIAPQRWYTHPTFDTRIERTMDGHYAICATVGAESNGLNYNFEGRPFLMKTDSNGDTLWTRSAGSDQFLYYIMDLLPHSDGGYMISGSVLGDLPEQQSGLMFIFKADSLGHFACAERTQPVQLLDLFPTDSSFTLTSVDGAVAHPANLLDTILPPVGVYDHCLMVPVHEGPEARRMQVRPNPTAAAITMSFTDPLRADSFYSVFDGRGRLLFQRPLPSGATSEDIDLGRFGQGVYLLKLTGPDGVFHERVVVSP